MLKLSSKKSNSLYVPEFRVYSIPEFDTNTNVLVDNFWKVQKLNISKNPKITAALNSSWWMEIGAAKKEGKWKWGKRNAVVSGLEGRAEEIPFKTRDNPARSKWSRGARKTQPNDALRHRLVEFLVFNSAFGRWRLLKSAYCIMTIIHFLRSLKKV